MRRTTVALLMNWQILSTGTNWSGSFP